MKLRGPACDKSDQQDQQVVTDVEVVACNSPLMVGVVPKPVCIAWDFADDDQSISDASAG